MNDTTDERRAQRRKGLRRVLAAAVVSLLILTILCWKTGIRVERVVTHLRQVRVFWLGVAFLLSALMHILAGAHKWYLILRGIGCDVTYVEVLFVRMGTDPIRFALPFKSGELSNILYFSRTGRLRVAESASWVLFDKALNLGGTLFWLVVGLLAARVERGQIPWPVVATGIVLLLPLVSSHFRRLGAAVAERTHKKLGRIARQILLTFDRISPRRKVGLVAYGIGFQLRPLIVCYLLMVGFGGQLATRPGPAEMLASGSIVALASNVPLTYWGTGPREAALVQLFKHHLAVPGHEAVLVAIGVLMCAAIHMVPAVIGLPLLGSFLNALSAGRAVNGTGNRGFAPARERRKPDA